MRAAVLFFGGGKRDRVAEIAHGLGEALERDGHRVDIIDGDRNTDAKLTVYEYLAIGTSVTSLFGGKITPRVEEYLTGAGSILGKKSFAFVTKSPFGSQKGLNRLMSVMEKQGLFLRYSEVLRSRAEAGEVAHRLKLER